MINALVYFIGGPSDLTKKWLNDIETAGGKAYTTEPVFKTGDYEAFRLSQKPVHIDCILHTYNLVRVDRDTYIALHQKQESKAMPVKD